MKKKSHARVVTSLLLSVLFATPLFGQAEITPVQVHHWWQQLGIRGPEGTAAALNFVQHPELMLDYFDERLQPLILEKEKFDRLLRQLASDDEATWGSAFTEFEYLDPRLYQDIDSIMESVPRNPARKRMAAILSNYSLEGFKKQEDSQDSLFQGRLRLRQSRGTGDYNLVSEGGARSTAWVVDGNLNGWHRKPIGKRVGRAIMLLGLQNSPRSVEILQRMAQGKKEIGVTVSAEKKLANLDRPDRAKFDVNKCWEALSDHGDQTIATAIQMVQHPDASTGLLAEKLKAVSLSEMEFETLLADLSSPVNETWQEAYQEFRFLDPRIFADLESLLERVPENPARIRMIGILSHWDVGVFSKAETHIDLEADITFTKHDKGYYLVTDGQRTWSAHDDLSQPLVLNAYMMPEWKRIAQAVTILEFIGTPEAIKVIEKVAAGSERAAPTVFAQKALARTKGK